MNSGWRMYHCPYCGEYLGELDAENNLWKAGKLVEEVHGCPTGWAKQDGQWVPPWQRRDLGAK